MDAAASSPSCSSSTVTRTVLLRACFVGSLVIAAITTGVISYRVMEDLQADVALQTYNSVAESALSNAQAITERKLQGGEVMRQVLAHSFSNASQWPFVALPGYVPISSAVADLSNTRTQGLAPLVRPEQADEFERHAAETYRKGPYHKNAGKSGFGFGIYTQSRKSPYEDGRVHDTSGVPKSYKDSRHVILAPIFEYNIVRASSLLYDVHSDKFRGPVVESMMDCAAAGLAVNDTVSPPCSVVTDFVPRLRRPGPAGLIYVPVYPENDPAVMVALVSTSIHWEDVLQNVVPEFVDGLDCVVSTPTKAYTFTITAGVPELRGEGDLHDPTFDRYMRDILLTPLVTAATASAPYRLRIYPTQTWLREFESSAPRAVALSLVALFVVCSIFFFVYDFFMRSESHERKVMLQMKKRYIRFISHEIRTPQNTVTMGLELLLAELNDCLRGEQNGNHHHHEEEEEEERTATDSSLAAAEAREELILAADDKDYSSTAGQEKEVATRTTLIDEQKERISKWFDLTHDIFENSQKAVDCCNDVLNYDTISSQSFKLEVEAINFWELVRKTTGEFSIQARRSKINLEMHTFAHDQRTDDGNLDHDDEEMGNHGEEQPGRDRLIVMGDAVRLKQIVGNLLSNAIKFTCEDGTVTVNLLHIPDGLPHALPLRKDGTLHSSTHSSKGCINNRKEKRRNEDVELACRHPRAGAIRLTVEDTGVGMSREQLDKVFREGVQFDPNKLQAGGGSGLGMFITKGLATQHGGTIRADSAGHGLGTTFTVDLPLYISDAIPPTTADTECTDHPSTELPISPTKKKYHNILVVDDAMLNRKMLIRLLERSGHVCSQAEDGCQALEVWQANQSRANNGDEPLFDTILIDWEMPRLNGPDATQQLREMGCKALIIGVTGNVLAEDVAYFKSKGADYVLPKPVNITRLAECWESTRLAHAV